MHDEIVTGLQGPDEPALDDDPSRQLEAPDRMTRRCGIIDGGIGTISLSRFALS
jgi:hypothetical protein